MRALCRAVPSSFAHALSAAPPDPPIDVALARAQHAAYVAALGALGVAVTVLPADEALPDCTFVEDTAVVAGGTALVTRPGAPSRRAEVTAVAAALAGLDVHVMEAPATLDGGDVLRAGRTFFVGLSARTNRAGADRLAAAFPDHRVIALEVPPSVLHLKSACSPLGDEAILLAEGSLDPHLFRGVDIVSTPEAHAANAVAVGNGVVVAAGAPGTRALLERRGLRVIEVDTGEMRKADGALTCLSILL